MIVQKKIVPLVCVFLCLAVLMGCTSYSFDLVGWAFTSTILAHVAAVFFELALALVVVEHYLKVASQRMSVQVLSDWYDKVWQPYEKERKSIELIPGHGPFEACCVEYEKKPRRNTERVITLTDVQQERISDKLRDDKDNLDQVLDKLNSDLTVLATFVGRYVEPELIEKVLKAKIALTNFIDCRPKETKGLDEELLRRLLDVVIALRSLTTRIHQEQ